MSLQDHFHPPLSVWRHWHAFHNGWAAAIAADLNVYLPKGYFAEPNVQFGIEIDVATFDESAPLAPHGTAARNVVSRSPAEAYSPWTPPSPILTIPFQLVTDAVEVLVYSSEAGPVLVGAIELISPANKDRAVNRAAFGSKCETYLQQGVGLVIVDVVTGRKANLHNELLARLQVPKESRLPAELYAAAYRLVERNGQPDLDIWAEPITVGRPLPTMPLWLRGNISLPVQLQATYERTCQEQRIVLHVA